MQASENIIISRTDSIGDVVLTLPMAKVLKDIFPGIKICFLGRQYTRPVIEACSNVDQFADVEQFMSGSLTIDGKAPQAILHIFPVAAIAKQAKRLNIPLRIGTTNRLYHWTTCNKLIKLSRKNSPLHEAQLNLQLLEAFGIKQSYSLTDIGNWFGLTRTATLKPEYAALPAPGKYHLILHPKSQGSAREWGLENFATLVKMLDKDKVQIFISGTAKEKELLQPLLDEVSGMATDISGMMDLEQFMAFIHACDGLVANSTGPLHIAAAMGKDAYGIYPPMRPIHPGRWAPLGPGAQVFVMNKDCNDCRTSPAACHCIKEVLPAAICDAIMTAATKNI